MSNDYKMIESLFHSIKLYNIRIKFKDYDLCIELKFSKGKDLLDLFCLEIIRDNKNIELFFREKMCLLKTMYGLMEEEIIETVELLTMNRKVSTTVYSN